MSADVTELAQLQAWMLGAVTRPEHGSPDPAQLVRPSPRLDPSQALAVYRGGYVGRVVSFMETMHPAVRHALGPDRFQAGMLDYFHHHPPRGHRMAGLDENLAAYLEAAGSGTGSVLPPGVALEFVVDLARLERLFHLVFDGPGTEDDQALGESPDRSPDESPDGPDGPDEGRGPHRPWLDTSLEPAPCVRLLASRFPVDAYRTSVRQGERPDPPAPADTFLVLSRRQFVVTVTELACERYAVLQALVAGVPPRTALSLAAPTRAETVVRWVEGWANEGLLRPMPFLPA
ncbi:MAG TPA: DNA-binding domain-containing protein [Acidimicrobiales bacterium]|nr:DNA-binding domain-containing protein [Acidimicrobiales bacterium]